MLSGSSLFFLSSPSHLILVWSSQRFSRPNKEKMVFYDTKNFMWVMLCCCTPPCSLTPTVWVLTSYMIESVSKKKLYLRHRSVLRQLFYISGGTRFFRVFCKGIEWANYGKILTRLNSTFIFKMFSSLPLSGRSIRKKKFLIFFGTDLTTS